MAKKTPYGIKDDSIKTGRVDMSVPTYDELFNPLLTALYQLGDSGSNSEIEEKVAEILNLTDEEINEIQKGNVTRFSYRLAWARTYLKNYGLLENSSRGVWALTPEGRKVERVDKEKVRREVQLQSRTAKEPELPETGPDLTSDSWEDLLLDKILNLSPQAFERLCQRILRESSFIQVEITGRSGDGGIDGKGVVRIGGLLSFHTIFQCKRYKGSVGSKEIRDFRGAMVGRADKGLFITTGKFTRDAVLEATRDGAPPIDLVDGERLVNMMKELGLGVKVQTVEVVEIDDRWFENF